MSRAKQFMQPDKIQLRRLFKELRKKRHEHLENNQEEKKIMFRRLEDNLFYIINKYSKNLEIINLCCYLSIKDELNILPCIINLKNSYDVQDKIFKIGLPKTNKFERAMKFYEYKEEFLITGKYNIKEPDENKCEEIIPNFIITPLLAFDKQKHRLGYGKGHYDNTFLKLKSEGIDFISIGIAYDEQFYDGDFPTDQYDQHLNFVVTPNKIF